MFKDNLKHKKVMKKVANWVCPSCRKKIEERLRRKTKWFLHKIIFCTNHLLPKNLNK